MKTIEKCHNCGLEVAYAVENREHTVCPRCEMPLAYSGDVAGTQVTLVPVSGPVNGFAPIVLQKGVHTLGRKSAKSNASVQIDVPDFFMSKRHSQIMVQVSPGIGVTVTVRDAGSSNGTFVNERRLAPGEETRMNEGDMFRMGDSRFKLQFN